jgi:hypothetical protein
VKKSFLTLAVLVALLSPVSAAEPTEEQVLATARELLSNYASAVVHVTAVVKITAQGPLAGAFGQREQRMETIGTVIGADGLTLVSNAGIDPAEALSGVRVTVSGQQHTLDLQSQVTEVKIRLEDGTELPGRIVLKDDDLDLAFIIPEKAVDADTAAKMSWVDLANASEPADLLDIVINVGRLGKQMNYENTLSVGRIQAKVTKPRTFYLINAVRGTAVFTAEGKVLGFSLVRKESKRVAGGRVQMTAIILPTADVKEIADQARAELQ